MNKAILFFLLLIPLCFVQASFEEIRCEEGINICVDINYSFLDTNLHCYGESFNFFGELYLEDNQYCRRLSSETFGFLDNTQAFCELEILNQSEETYFETFNYSFSCPEPVCGNEMLEDGEECDHNDLNGVLCEAGYNEFCSYCSLECKNETITGPYCGDGICQEGFEAWTNCNTDCEKPAICGDGILDDGEECDDNDGCCSDKCTIIKYAKKTRSSITRYEMDHDCAPRWECSSWSECLGDVKNRKCLDLNHCDYSYNMPSETAGCEIISEVKIEEDDFNFFPWIFSLIILLIVFSRLVQETIK